MQAKGRDAMSLVFNIQRCSVNDGPGIRTTVFLKGCPLRCLWCHNPESSTPGMQLMLDAGRCIGCGRCIDACPNGLHRFTGEGGHQIDRTLCTACGACAAACAGALSLVGKKMTIDAILKEVMKDRAFYRHSGGGMTLSGGEPLMHPEFTLALLKGAKEAGLHTCIETSGYARPADIEALLPYVDIFLWDIKECDPQRHKAYTGVSNERILENLRLINSRGAAIILRCPIIPGMNDRAEHFAFIAALAEELDGVTRVDVEPYHPLGKSKAESLGQTYPLGDLSFPPDEAIAAWIAAISAGTKKPVQKA